MAEAPDTMTITLDRRTAENFYYALALALGGAAPFDGNGKKNGGKGKGKSSGKPSTKAKGVEAKGVRVKGVRVKVLKGLI